MAVATKSLTAEDVRKAVQEFWTIFLAKSEEELNSFYAPGSTVFQVSMGRSEPGLGHRMSEQATRGVLETDPEYVIRTEVLANG